MNKKTTQQMESRADFDAYEKLMKAPNNYWHPKQFDYLLHWYFVPNKNQHIELELLKKMAQTYEIIFEVWQIQAESKHNLRMISISGVEKSNLINEFIVHTIKIITPIPFGQKFKIMKQKTFNKYGSYQQTDSLECTICLDKKTLNLKNCCGKIICKGCNVSEKCPFCNREEIIRRWIIPEELANFKLWLNGLFYQLLK